jgi:hypothetical protein
MEKIAHPYRGFQGPYLTKIRLTAVLLGQVKSTFLQLCTNNGGQPVRLNSFCVVDIRRSGSMEARMAVDRKLVKLLPILSMILASLLLVIAGVFAFFYYHGVLGNFLSSWFEVMGLSLFIIAGLHIFGKIMQDPNVARRCMTTPGAKRDMNLLATTLIFNAIMVSLEFSLLSYYLISSGIITKPIYDLMFTTALIVYLTAGIYGIWQLRKERRG